MITIYCNGKIHYRREDRLDPVVQETCHLMAYQNQVFGKSAYSIDWGEELPNNHINTDKDGVYMSVGVEKKQGELL
jgi:hypothetical protein